MRRGGMTRSGPMHKMGLLGAIRPQTSGTTGVNNMVHPYPVDNTHLGGRKRGAGFLSNLMALPSRLVSNIGLGKKGKLNPGLQAYLDKKRKHGGSAPMPGGAKGKLNPGLQAYLDKKRKQKGGSAPMPGGRRRKHKKNSDLESDEEMLHQLKKHIGKKGGRVPMPGGRKKRGGFWGMLAASLLPTLLNKALPDAQAGSKRRRHGGTAGIYYG